MIQSCNSGRALFIASFCLLLFLVSRESYYYFARSRNVTLSDLLQSMSASRRVAAHAHLKPVTNTQTTPQSHVIVQNALTDDDHCGMPYAPRSSAGDCRLKIAVAVNIIAGREAPTSNKQLDYEGFIDSAGVLAHAIKTRVIANSRFDIDLVALVLDSPRLSPFYNKLERFGWRIVKQELPVRFDEIAEGYYKQNLNKSGCCGMDEFVKLGVYEWEQYQRVLLLDADIMVLQSLDELFAAPEWIELVYTKGEEKLEIFQGGFWMIQPSRDTLAEMMTIVKAGAWYESTAWEGSGLGWVYGGPTIQGLMPFFYTKKRDVTKSLPVSHCHYNNQDGEKCHDTPIEQIKVFHFNFCQKPFRCVRRDEQRLCGVMFDQWWKLRNELETSLGLDAVQPCVDGNALSYIPIQLPQQ